MTYMTASCAKHPDGGYHSPDLAAPELRCAYCLAPLTDVAPIYNVDAFTAGRIQGLKDAMCMLPDFDFVDPAEGDAEQDFILDPKCSECGTIGAALFPAEWRNGDLCYQCAWLVVDDLPNKINAAISALAEGEVPK